HPRNRAPHVPPTPNHPQKSSTPEARTSTGLPTPWASRGRSDVSSLTQMIQPAGSAEPGEFGSEMAAVRPSDSGRPLSDVAVHTSGGGEAAGANGPSGEARSGVPRERVVASRPPVWPEPPPAGAALGAAGAAAAVFTR